LVKLEEVGEQSRGYPATAFSFLIVRMGMRGVFNKMSLITPDDDSGGVSKILQTAKKQFEEVGLEIERFRQEFGNGETVDPAELKKRGLEYRNVASHYLQEASRFEDAINKRDGIVNGYALDFDEARREIGRRLGCLRRARDSDEISE
jgi:hypothetical protein